MRYAARLKSSTWGVIAAGVVAIALSWYLHTSGRIAEPNQNSAPAQATSAKTLNTLGSFTTPSLYADDQTQVLSEDILSSNWFYSRQEVAEWMVRYQGYTPQKLEDWLATTLMPPALPVFACVRRNIDNYCTKKEFTGYTLLHPYFDYPLAGLEHMQNDPAAAQVYALRSMELDFDRSIQIALASAEQARNLGPIVSLYSYLDYALEHEHIRFYSEGDAPHDIFVALKNWDPEKLAERRHFTADLVRSLAPDNRITSSIYLPDSYVRSEPAKDILARFAGQNFGQNP